MNPTLFGYARISNKSQAFNSSIETQKKHLLSVGVEDFNFFFEPFTKRSLERPKLKEVFSAMKPGDILIITRMDRISRSLKDTYKFQAELDKKSCFLRCLSDDVSTKTPGSKLSFAVLAAVAEFEADIRAERVKAGEAKKKAGFLFLGRKPLLTVELKQAFYENLKNPKLTLKEIALK